MHHLQIEYLKELMNIAVGASTAIIADILDAFGSMNIPEVEVLTPKKFLDDMAHYFDADKTYYTCKQNFNGMFSGEALFVLDEVSSINLSKHMYKKDSPELHEINDSVQELSNIINATLIGKIVENLETDVQFSVPSTLSIKGDNIVSKEKLAAYHKIIMIKTSMRFETEDITATVMILTKDNSIAKLKLLIESKLEELFS